MLLSVVCWLLVCVWCVLAVAVEVCCVLLSVRWFVSLVYCLLFVAWCVLLAVVCCLLVFA